MTEEILYDDGTCSEEESENVHRHIFNELLDTIRSFRKTDMLRILSDRALDVSHPINNGTTPLIVAVESDNLWAIRVLLERGTDVNICGSTEDVRYDGFPVKRMEAPLITAVRLGKEDIARLLVDSGALMEPPGCEMAALLWACNIGRIDLVRYLLDHGADVDVRGDYSFTALLEIVTESQNVNILQLLLEKGADMSITSDTGNTALMIALLLSAEHMATYLIRAGSDVNAVNETGLNPLAIAIADLSTDSCELLVIAGARITPEHIVSLSTGHSAHAELREMMVTERRRPASLLRQCTVAVRKQLLIVSNQCSILELIPRLPIPMHMHEYIVFNIF